MLAGEQGLARVSTTPGFTKLINLFTMNKCWRLVDLPGYGFAHGPKQDRTRFSAAVSDYLENRPNLSLVFALIDSRLAPQAIDLEFVEWLVRHAVPFVFVFTKTDKVTPATVQANIAAFTARISAWFEKLPAVFTSSAQTRQGRPELLAVIDEAMTAIKAASIWAPAANESSPSLSLPAPARENRKHRPDLHRPW
jgi:GTP-binding protein